ncbi:small heat shock protein [Boletus reticuloceps]|uniref:Small heat shock protein n=1 Tax=Boletus reticuloceps TaxID=495285 RepID=A0A8I2YET1_9AGAM|nr:small heat shock protein [Boletus reticuloceps]
MSSLIRFHYDPFTDFDRLFDDAFNARFWPSSVKAGPTGCATTDTTQHLDSFRPRMDVKESKDANIITATIELPGLKSEDVAISIQQDRLTVSGESAAPHAHESDGYGILERRYGKLSGRYSFRLDQDVNAKLENGLLTVTFPKANPEQQPQRIAIQ